ncbi:MAG: sugar transferase [Defluviitaleaceae bacterium]|nr:sugar transferase [Defluviitaleaceae bacterium]
MYIYVKRVMDILFMLASAPLWIPLMVWLAILVKVTSSGTVFFKQKRFGRNGKFFMIYKFRSMYTDAPKDVPTHLLKDPQAHITPIGRFLRKSSLDELPQVFNILKGELTLVGPRPALWNQDDLIAEREKYGANAIPVGLTGLAQVRGRDELPINTKAAYDGEYAQKMSFTLDIKILFQTAINALTASGISEGGPAGGNADDVQGESVHLEASDCISEDEQLQVVGEEV